MEKITKAAALDKFVERLMDDSWGLAISGTSCTYSHDFNGGCAIGCLLPKKLAAEIQEARSYSEPVSAVFANRPDVAGLFETPESSFWRQLQAAHDNLAFWLDDRSMAKQADFIEALRCAAYFSECS